MPHLAKLQPPTKLAGFALGMGLAFLARAGQIRNDVLNFDHFITLPDDELPGLSIVIAAKDEAATIGPALRSLLELDYPELEIVLVDDRSVDGTGEIADALRLSHPQGERLTIIHNEELPEGWLGKVYALHLGCRRSRHPVVLTTDADVHFSPDSLKRAMSIREVLDCDHLVAAPQIEARGFWEPLLTGYFLILFAARFQPSLVHRRPKSYVGVGAFNMLTRGALERMEFLEPLRLQVTDDVHLGRLVKSLGMSQYCVIAQDYIRVRWFQGLRGCVEGLEKNAYAGLNYSLWFALSVICTLLLFSLSPLLLPVLGFKGWGLGLFLFQGLVGFTIPKTCHLPRWVGFLFPLAGLVLCYTFARSTWITEKQKGVKWRDTLYPLETLREAHWRFLREQAPL